MTTLEEKKKGTDVSPIYLRVKVSPRDGRGETRDGG